MTAFSSGNGGKEETSLRVRTLKTLMATLCAGKLMDKLRYIFSQLADANGHLVHARSGFLRSPDKDYLGLLAPQADKAEVELIPYPKKRLAVNNPTTSCYYLRPEPVSCLAGLTGLKRM